MTAPSTLLCPRCGSSDVHVRSVTADGTVELACTDPNCPGLWPTVVAPEHAVEVRRLGALLAIQRDRAEIRRNSGHRRTAVQWESRARGTVEAIRALLESEAA